VTYDDAQLADIQRGMIQVVLPWVRAIKGMRLEPETGWNFLRGLTLRLALGCVNASVFFKHPAYRSERAHRFLQLHTFDDKLAMISWWQ
jgi:hypothetical protein